MTPDRWRLAGIATAVAALALATLLAVGGSTVGGALRVALVLAIAAVLVVGLRRRARLAAVAGALLGPLVLAIGVGFGPHLFAAPASIRGFGAAGAVAGGFGLVGFGTASATEGMRRRGRIPTWLGMVVLVLLTLAVVGPAVAVVNVPDSTASRTAAEPPLDAEPVSLPTSDGVTLAAWWVPGTNGAAVLVRHGAGSTHEGALAQATVLADHGYGVLLMDARGHGESTGRAMDFGWWGDADIAAGLDHLVARPDVDGDRIGVLGLSMGGEEAIGAATDPRVGAVVAEGATARRAADKDWLSDVHGWRGAVQERIEQLQYGLTDLLTDAPRPTVLRDAVVSSEVPVLLMAAGQVADEGHAAAWIAAGAPERVEVWTVDGAGHTDGLGVAPEEWERRVVGFLDEHL
ncbi:alpha/beta hydrolase [Acidimicrobiia bacterium EGI L10123]|uniref:alpha/beta hydrolase n=1 Tax=Salinilacustrithrix flava TaxID=2957203 RepID=UPI003D7C1944|nr:alpha/beta hydrolase [Acidimicrobiia bacterium EGI L10123]